MAKTRVTCFLTHSVYSTMSGSVIWVTQQRNKPHHGAVSEVTGISLTQHSLHSTETGTQKHFNNEAQHVLRRTAKPRHALCCNAAIWCVSWH